jgi:hypothetical protein
MLRWALALLLPLFLHNVAAQQLDEDLMSFVTVGYLCFFLFFFPPHNELRKIDRRANTRSTTSSFLKYEP